MSITILKDRLLTSWAEWLGHNLHAIRKCAPRFSTVSKTLRLGSQLPWQFHILAEQCLSHIVMDGTTVHVIWSLANVLAKTSFVL
jgi:hypothetical protein